MNWIGYARTGKELEVEAAISELDIACAVPRKVEALRRGKKRHAEAVISPALPNYVFITASADQWHALRTVKHLARTMLALTPGSQRDVLRFLRTCREDYEDRMRRIEAGERVTQYDPGDILDVIAGPLAGQIATFRRLVEGSETFPEIEAEVAVFGRATRVRLDPLQAKRRA